MVVEKPFGATFRPRRNSTERYSIDVRRRSIQPPKARRITFAFVSVQMYRFRWMRTKKTGEGWSANQWSLSWGNPQATRHSLRALLKMPSEAPLRCSFVRTA